MKVFFLTFLLLNSLSVFAQQSLMNATIAQMNILTTYLAEDFDSSERIIDALDEYQFTVQTFEYENKTYEMMVVYSGDTAHGPIYLKDTLKIVGRNSDGQIIIDGKYINLPRKL